MNNCEKINARIWNVSAVVVYLLAILGFIFQNMSFVMLGVLLNFPRFFLKDPYLPGAKVPWPPLSILIPLHAFLIMLVYYLGYLIKTQG